jgi:hypothetical protein
MIAGRCGLGILLLVALLGRVAVAASCDVGGADAQDVGNARIAIARNCDCGVARHKDYTRCAREQAEATLVNPGCRNTVVRCASRSTCGRPGAVSCCRTNAHGVTRCSIKSSTEKCTAPRGGQACVGSFTSCCDACHDGGCVSPTPPEACSGGSAPPQCGGTCPPGTVCVDNPGSGGCVCTGTACGETEFPQCGGVCPGLLACVPFQSFENGVFRPVCGCGIPNASCPTGSGSVCGTGGSRCPPGQACTFSPVSPDPNFPPPLCGCTGPF